MNGYCKINEEVLGPQNKVPLSEEESSATEGKFYIVNSSPLDIETMVKLLKSGRFSNQ